MVECLPNKCEALSSNPKKGKKKKKEKGSMVSATDEAL
jgi:hypothetical protein